MSYNPRLAFGTKLLMGDGGAPAVKASLTNGSTNSQIVFTAKTAGVAGNSITVTITNDATLAVSVTGTDIEITADTSGDSVNDVIAAVYASAAAAALVDVTNGVGDGTGNIGALTETALTSGANSAEVFSEIKGLTDIAKGGPTREEVDVTNHSSANGAIETKPEGVFDPGSVTATMFFDPTDTQHIALKTAFDNKTVGNWRLQLPTDAGSVTYEFTAWVKGFGGENYPVRGAITKDLEVRITGDVTEV